MSRKPREFKISKARNQIINGNMMDIAGYSIMIIDDCQSLFVCGTLIRTSAPIGAWKSNFPPDREITTDQSTVLQTDISGQTEILLLIMDT